MTYVRKLIKISTLLITRILGIFTVRGPLVLMYHSVGGLDSKHSISPESFEKQLTYLVSKYPLVSLEDVVLWIQGKKEIPKNSVALTFDDGYKDTKEILLPLLAKYNVKATLFLTTFLDELPVLGNMPRPSVDDIRAIHKTGYISIQSHGHVHKNLTLLSREETEKDLSQNKSIIRDITGENPIYFAYPFGYKNSEVVKVVSGMFQGAVGIGEGSNQKNTNVFNIKRVQVDKTVTFFEFKLRLTSALDINRKVVDSIRNIWNKRK
jgi:peptidoglycan/xylan/chitin deacetylase (PgdA/CDA1 family)